MTMHPWWARFVGILWLLAGGLLLVTGAVVVVDQHDWLRWEFLLGVAVLLVGVRAWTRSVTVDAHGIEDRAGRHRQRLLWSTVDHVAVGSEDRHGGPVTVWRRGASDPVVLRGSWGTSRSQRLEFVEGLRDLVGPFGVTVSSDVAADVDGGPGAPSDGDPDGHASTWTARGPADA